MVIVLFVLLLGLMIIVIIFALFTLFAIYSSAPYVPTHNRLVEKMLDMAEVGEHDMVVDLGAGDGRIVMAAALRGERAVGYEINPLLVIIANLRIQNSKFKSQKFNSKLKIYWKNFWNQDLSSATVITIFGFPNMMERLEKKLQRELQPGSRVVSHAFKFPNWQPVKKEGGLLLYEVK